MIALGLALTLVAAWATVFAVIASANSSTAISLTALGITISASPLDLFLAGALWVVLLGLGFSLVSRGTRRTARTHKELKQLRKDKAITATTAAADREEQRKDAARDDNPTDSPRQGADQATGRGAPDPVSTGAADSASKDTQTTAERQNSGKGSAVRGTDRPS